jgi:hypothetical protein
MRAWLVLLAVLPFTGCLESGSNDDCAALAERAVVESIDGRDARVRLGDGEPAVLHLSAAVFVKDSTGCTMSGPEGVRVGDTITFEVDAWAESYPMQGWPETAVVVR